MADLDLPTGSAPIDADALRAAFDTAGLTTQGGKVGSLAATVSGLVDGADPAILSDTDPADVAAAPDAGALTTVSRGDHAHALVPAAHVAALGQTTSNPPTQAQVQAIATKVDAILTALINAGLMASS